jgi:hypothetical protein
MISIEELRRDAAIMTRWEQHRFLTLIGGVILISLFLVSVALSLYNSSGAAQLDLSRPGYQDVRDLAKRDTVSKSFPASGVLDKEALDLFSKLYGEQSAKVVSADSFDASAISEDSLQLLSENRNDPTVGQ